MAIGQYHPFSIKNVFSSYETIFPPNQSQEVINLLTETNKKIVCGFGLRQGRTHAEYMISGCKCYLIEIGARGGGAYFSSDNVRYISGISSEDFLIDMALGLKANPIVNENDKCFCCCTLFFYLPPNGEVIGTEGIEHIQALEFIARNNLYQIKKGIKTSPLDDKSTRYFFVIKADSYEQLNTRIAYIRAHLKIETKISDGQVLLPIWF